MASIGGFSIAIGADASSAIEAFGKLNNKATDLERGLSKMANVADKSASVAIKGLTVPIVAGTAALGAATKAAVTFDNSMREVATLLPNLSKDGFGKLKQEALEFSQSMGIIPDEVVPAMYQAISAGVPEKNVFSFLEVAGKAAIAGVTDLTTSVDGLTSVSNAYGPAIMNAQKASDIMFTTVKLGKTDFAQLSSSLFNVIPTAAAAGVAFEDVGAALAVVTAQGTPTSVATTQIRAALNDLTKEGSDADKAFQQFSGKTFEQFIASGGNLQEALELMSKGATDTGVSIKSMFSSQEAGNAVLALTGTNAKNFANALNETKNAAGATQAAFETIDEGPARQFERMKAETAALVTELGTKLLPVVCDSLLPALRSAMPLLEGGVKTVGSLVSAFNNFSPAAKAVTVGAIGLAAGIGPAVKGTLALGRGISDARDTLKSANEAFKTAKTAISGFSSVKKASALATGLATKAQIAFNASMFANPVVLVTAAVAALAVGIGVLAVALHKKEKAEREALVTAKKNADVQIEQARAMSSQTTEATKLASRYDELACKTKLTTEEQAEQVKLGEELKKIYPDLNVAYDENGRALNSLSGQVAEYTSAKEQETLATIKSTMAEINNVRAKQQSKIATLEAAAAKGSGVYATKQLEKERAEMEALDKSLNDLNTTHKGIEMTIKGRMELAYLARKEAEKSAASQETTAKKEAAADAKSTKGKKDKIKVYADYIAEIEGNLEKQNRWVEAQEALGIKVDSEAVLKQKQEQIRSGVETLTKELKITPEQMEDLKLRYGDLINLDLDKASFDKAKAKLKEELDAFEKNFDVEMSFDGTLTELDKAKGKSDLLKRSVLDIAKTFNLTVEQAKELADSFGGIGDAADSSKEKFEKMVASIKQGADSFFSVSDSIIGAMESASQIKTNKALAGIEKIKGAKLKAIDLEKNAFLKANNAMEKSEKDRLRDSIAGGKKRLTLALGLYEREALEKQLQDDEAALARETLEEESAAKILETETAFEKEKLNIEYKGNLEGWKLKLASATASIAQAILSAGVSAMQAGPFPAPLIALPLLIGALASGFSQINALQANKPQPPQLADGGIVRRRIGGMNAIIGEGNSNEAVIPLRQDVLAGIGTEIQNATLRENKNVSNTEQSNSQNDFFVTQPLVLQINGKQIIDVVLEASRRGFKVVHHKGIEA